MAYVMKLVALANGYPSPMEGHYVVEFDPDAHDGRGFLLTAENVREAKRYPDKVDAFEDWRRQSTVRPLRDDGEPNRPLTAFTVEIAEAPK